MHKSAEILIEKYKTDSELDLEFRLTMVKVYASLGHDVDVRGILKELRDQVDKFEIWVIKAMLMKAKGEYGAAKEALEASLEDNGDNFEALILLGQLQWDNNDDPSRSLNSFLKAAKVTLDNFNSDVNKITLLSH